MTRFWIEFLNKFSGALYCFFHEELAAGIWRVPMSSLVWGFPHASEPACARVR